MQSQKNKRTAINTITITACDCGSRSSDLLVTQQFLKPRHMFAESWHEPVNDLTLPVNENQRRVTCDAVIGRCLATGFAFHAGGTEWNWLRCNQGARIRHVAALPNLSAYLR